MFTLLISIVLASQWAFQCWCIIGACASLAVGAVVAGITTLIIYL